MNSTKNLKNNMTDFCGQLTLSAFLFIMHISEAFHCATRQNADRLFNFCGFYVIIYVSVFRFENKS